MRKIIIIKAVASFETNTLAVIGRKVLPDKVNNTDRKFLSFLEISKCMGIHLV